MKKHLFFIVSIAFALYFASCTKDVDIPFPEVEPVVVVDGQITAGAQPVVFLTRSQSFNQPLGLADLESLFENNAVVMVSNGTDTVQLDEVCAANLSEAELNFVAEAVGVDPEQLQAINYCAYFQLEIGAMIGEVGKDYELMITTSDGQRLNSSTSVLPAIPLDSLWFEEFGSEDTLGFMHAILSDPADEVNAYRWSAQRINSRPGETGPKDPGFIYPVGSAFEDRFFDGLTFEIFYNRGGGTVPEEETAETAGFFNVNDTVAVRFATISLETYDYITISDQQAANNGSPFAVPANLPGNVDGGLGLWAGYSFVVDTFPK